MRKAVLLLVVLSSVVFTQVALTAQKKTVAPRNSESGYRYDTAGAKLEGMLMERKVYGPPGYGETPSRDSHETIFVLKLSPSISVQPATNAEVNGSASLDPVENVREIQLFVDRSQKPPIQLLIGHQIVVTGTLNESITASQYTRVWLDVATFGAK